MLRAGLLVLCGIASAQEPYRVGGGVTAPVPIFQPMPVYSDEALKAGVNARVLLSLVVNADGTPKDIRVVRDAGFGLDEKAIESVSRFRFKPGEREGAPVPVIANIEQTYRVYGDFRPAARLTFQLPPGAGSRPVLAKGAPLKLDRLPSPPEIRVKFEVAPNGNVEQVDSSTGAPDELLKIIRGWRFSADDKRPAPVAAQLELSYK